MKKTILIVLSLCLAAGQAAAGETYDQARFLSRVRQHSRELKLVDKELELAGVRKKEAFSAALPQVFAEAGYTRNLSDYYMYADFGAMLGGEGGISKFKVNFDNEYSANVVLRQTLFSPGVRSGIRAAEQYRRLTETAYAAGEQTIFSTAKKIFHQTLLLEKVVDLARDAEGNAHENYLNVQLKYENGVVSQFELLQAEVRWKNAVPETEKAERNLALALNNLKTWAGLPIDEPLDLEGGVDEVPDLPVRPEFETILSSRPDFNVLQWEEKLRRTSMDAKRAAFIPTLSANLVYAFSSQANRFRMDNRNNLFTAGLTLSVPLFTGGYNSAQVAEARIELEKSRLRIEKARDEIHNEVADIYLRMKEARERIASATATQETAQKAFDIAETASRSGIITQLELKDARIGYDQAKLNTYAAVFDYLAAYFDWEKATGTVTGGDLPDAE
ncbi:MAG: TolC family protein [Candidatus Aminicenantales bacterium]